MPIHGPPGGERGKDTRRDVGGGAGKTEGWNIYIVYESQYSRLYMKWITDGAENAFSSNSGA